METGPVFGIGDDNPFLGINQRARKARIPNETASDFYVMSRIKLSQQVPR
jgi:hypothetical protein